MKNYIKNVKIFADGADKKSMLELNKKDWISGFTTNPTLLRKAGIINYKEFALDILSEIKEKPVSFEVFADDFDEMKRQALEIASWDKYNNIYIKIPITNTKKESSCPLIHELSHSGVKVNVTAVFSIKQVELAFNALQGGCNSIISIFCGRIADTGKSPINIMKPALLMCAAEPNIELLWASPRELYNIIECQESGCHIITVSHDILAKIDTFGKDLEQYSLETIRMFFDDGQKSGFIL